VSSGVTSPPASPGGGGGGSEHGGLTLESVKRRLLRGSAWVTGGRMLSIALGLALNAVLTRILTKTEVGEYFTTMALVFVGSIIAQLGLDRAVVRFVSTALALDKPGQAKQVVKRVFFFCSIGAVVTALVLALGLGRWIVTHIYHDEVLATLMPLAAGWLIITALQQLLVDTFRGFQRFDLSTLFDQVLIDILSVSIFGAIFLLHKAVDVHQVVLLSTVFALTTTVIGAGLLLGKLHRLGEEGEPLPKGELFAMAWPLLITNIAIYLLGTSIDVWILGAFRPQSQVALYGVASRVMFLVATPYLILQGVTPPLIAEMFAKGKKREMERTLRMVSTVAGLPAALALIGFLLFGGQLLHVFYGPGYEAAAGVLAILSAGRLVAVWTGSAGVTLMMTGHQKSLMYITVFSGIASVTADLLLAPHFGKVGVAIGTASTQAMQNILQVLLAKRLVGVWTMAHLSPKPLIEFLKPQRSSSGPSSGSSSGSAT
jgi:O-antigen/teichoic acid export membrane protein